MIQIATTTIHNFASDGSYIARGVTTSFNDGDTIDTGLVRIDGMLPGTNTADCVATLTSQSAGVATVAAKTAGAAASGVTIYWIAWQKP